MDIKHLVEEAGYQPKRKAFGHGGEYSSPCPFCKDGDDRFLIWPSRANSNGEYQGGRFSCRVCGLYGDAITFLRQLYGMSYVDACSQLRIEPKKRSEFLTPELPKLRTAQDPPDLWKEKASLFIDWSHKQLMKSKDGWFDLRKRGFTQESIDRFKLGFNPGENGWNIKREREDWGLPKELKDDGNPDYLYLSKGLTIPTFSSDGQVIRINIRNTFYEKEKKKYEDQLAKGEKPKWVPRKYIIVKGSKECPSIFGNTSLPCVVLESEFDALLIQQEADDLVCCMALSGSTKPLDLETDHLLRKSSKILFLPDFDQAGAVAWSRWKDKFSNIRRILTPHEKSAGDYFLAEGDLREWIESELNEGDH